MSKISTQSFVKYYQQNFGEGTEGLKELLPPDRFLDLDDFIQAPDQIWPDFASSLTPIEQKNLLEVWAHLRAKPVFDLENPFLSPGDPPREHTANPTTPGSPNLPIGIPTVLVAGRALPLGSELARIGLTHYGGDQVFVKHAAQIDTKDWEVTGGNVRFQLLEGPNRWGPWTSRCDFSLRLGDPPHTGCHFIKLTWWALVVSATVDSKFTALPFAW